MGKSPAAALTLLAACFPFAIPAKAQPFNGKPGLPIAFSPFCYEFDLVAREGDAIGGVPVSPLSPSASTTTSRSPSPALPATERCQLGIHLLAEVCWPMMRYTPVVRSAVALTLCPN
ncbi:MAG: hypothetical protein AAGD11_19265 [Planctomycetota bacterium]